jgi:ferric-dicitrate binding protein FerR (iron transport regulator)
MLFSECEGIEYWRLPESAALDVRADHGVEEAVVVLSGELVFHPEGEDVLPLGVHTGQGVLLPHGTTGSLVAVGDDTRLITVRGLSVAVSRSLPPRRPELAADTSG